jgi:shikimate kinase
MGKSVVLVGPRCCGKTSAGIEIAGLLNAPFVDADNIFVDLYGSVNDFVKKHNGWEKFREYETQIIEDICRVYQDKQIVLTPGGGAVAHDQGEEYRKRNVELLREFGQIFYLLPSCDLEQSAGVLTRRMLEDQTSAGQRPSLTGETDAYKEMLNVVTKRHPLYSAAAHAIFYTGEKTVKEVAQNIAEFVK